MRHRRPERLALAVLCLAAAGCGGGGDDDDRRKPGSGDAIPLRQQLGELLVSSFEGARLPAYLERRLAAGETSGVILFGKNAPSAAAVRALTRSIQRAGRRGALVTTDQEGGAIRSLAFTERLEDLRPLGVNVNLAPVADVASTAGSVMAGRAFPGDAPAVARATRDEIEALRRARLAATVKHFPGIGRATENTDDAPVTIAATRDELEEVDLEPFRAAIAEGAPLVMASHALYPAWDPEHIASQSPVVLEELLRGRLGFEGVVVTDSLEADAVLARSSVEVAAERSLAAGADLLLMTGQASWNSVFPHLLRRARRSPALRERIAESAARVRELKRTLGLRVPD